MKLRKRMQHQRLYRGATELQHRFRERADGCVCDCVTRRSGCVRNWYAKCPGVCARGYMVCVRMGEKAAMPTGRSIEAPTL